VNFLDICHSELRRKPLSRTPVNTAREGLDP
jgi:hypothetical protein